MHQESLILLFCEIMAQVTVRPGVDCYFKCQLFLFGSLCVVLQVIFGMG